MKFTILSILSINPSMFTVIVAVVGLFLAFFLICFILRKRNESKFRKLANELTGEIRTATQELEELFFPTHLVTENDMFSTLQFPGDQALVMT